jgi:hypothetical protein
MAAVAAGMVAARRAMASMSKLRRRMNNLGGDMWRAGGDKGQALPPQGAGDTGAL